MPPDLLHERPLEALKPFRVVVFGTHTREWSRYSTFEKADEQARALRKLGMDAHVLAGQPPDGPDPPKESPKGAEARSGPEADRSWTESINGHSARRPRGNQAEPEPLEFGDSWPAFLCWALMVGATKPEIVAARIIDDLEREATA